MRKDIAQENKERYDELNPVEGVGSKMWWAIAAVVLAMVFIVFYAV